MALAWIKPIQTGRDERLQGGGDLEAGDGPVGRNVPSPRTRRPWSRSMRTVSTA